MRLAIIGSGNVGSSVARAARRTGHEVVVADIEKDKLAELGATLGVETTTSHEEALRGADAVVLAVPFGVVEEVAASIADHVGSKVVIDVTNPLTPDYSGLATGEISGAEIVQSKLPGSRVVKAFNTVFASNQDTAEVDGVQLDGFVAGDDAEAKRKVADLLAEIGFRPIDAGSLAAARYLEAMAFLNISLNAANGWSWQTGWKLVGPTN